MSETVQKEKSFQRVSQGDMPRASLQEALVLTRALADEFAGSDATPIDLASSVKRSPTSSSWRYLTGAAVAYGLTTGGYGADFISLTGLGKQIQFPEEEGQDLTGMLMAATKPAVLKRFYEKYDKNKFPSDEIAKNILRSFGVPSDRLSEALAIVKDNALLAGILTDASGGKFIQLRRTAVVSQAVLPDEVEVTAGETEDDALEGGDLSEQQLTQKPKPIFIAHGKEKAPLDQLTKILEQFRIPYLVAAYEAHAGRPISEKVRATMNQCGSAIVVFSSGDEQETVDSAIVPNLNVVFELGAASVLYGDKVVIFKEEQLVLPSDFSGLGYIPFKKGNLEAKAFDLVKELISLGFVQVVPTG